MKAIHLLWAALALTPVWARNDQTKLVPRLEALMAWETENLYAGTVLVAREGTVLLHKGYGLANQEKAIPNDVDTVFDIGSISKIFTAVAILNLEMDGKLRISDPLSRFFPDTPADKANITLEQLLSHTSGLRNFHDTQGDFEKMSRDKAIREIFRRPLRYTPGERFAYSNSGYGLLAAVVELVSQSSLQAYLKQTIFEPAGMTSTGFYGDPRWTETNTAHGYTPNKDRGSPRTWPGPFWALLGGGGIVSTAGDLYHFHRALNAHKLLDRKTLANMRTPRTEFESRSGVKYRYGLGLMMRETPWGNTLEHGGANDFGFSALYCYLPEKDVVTIVTANRADGENFPVRPVSNALHERLFKP